MVDVSDAQVAGKLALTGAVPGTLLGPDSTGRTFVVLGEADDKTLVGYATVEDLTTARERVMAEGVGPGCQSVTEWNMRKAVLRQMGRSEP